MIVGTQIVYKLQAHIIVFFAGYKDSRMEVYKCISSRPLQSISTII